MRDAVETTDATARDVRPGTDAGAASPSAPIDRPSSRALAAFNAEGGYPSLLPWRSHEAPDGTAVKTWSEHATRCREALERGPDLHAAAGLALADGLERGVAGLADGLERLLALIDDDWDALEPPLNAARPAKAWNARKFAVEALDDRSLVAHYLLRLPWFGLERPLGPCWRACLFANGTEGDYRLAGDEDERGHAQAAPLRAAFAEAGDARLATLRGGLARARAALGPDGIGERFSARARASSDALGAEARGASVSLATLAEFLGTVQGYVDAYAPAEPAAGTDGTDAPEASAPDAVPASADPSPARAPAGAATPRFESVTEARAALDAAVGWFLVHEPSSPALVPLALARRVDGLSFPETLEALGAGADDSLQDAAAELHARLDRLGFDRGAAGALAGLDAIGSAVDAPADPTADAPVAPPVVVPDRARATALLAAHAAHRRAVDPSSPVAMLVERALGLVPLRFEEIVATLGTPSTQPEESDS